jgi:SAM-dependent methyltransferase
LPPRYHEIAEHDLRILNPFSLAKLIRIGSIAQLRKGMDVLDLACGKGEMLCQWAKHFGVRGVGVDLSKVFLEAARSRAKELEVEDSMQFIEGDAGKYEIPRSSYDVISCIGATWIRGDLDGTSQFMRPGLRKDGSLMVGEPFWRQLPLPEKYKKKLTADDLKMSFRDLASTLKRIENNGMEPVGMILASEDDWDRYETAHWRNVERWVGMNSKDPDANEFRATMRRERETYLRWGRSYMGWGIFISKPKGSRDE